MSISVLAVEDSRTTARGMAGVPYFARPKPLTHSALHRLIGASETHSGARWFI
jgi:hypothetical protein